MVKQMVSRKLRTAKRKAFWQARYYDFNVWSECKRVEKLRYLHRNPVTRGLGRIAPGLGVEQLPALSHWRGRGGRDRIAVDGAKAGATWNLSDCESARLSLKPPAFAKNAEGRATLRGPIRPASARCYTRSNPAT